MYILLNVPVLRVSLLGRIALILRSPLNSDLSSLFCVVKEVKTH